MANYYGNPLVLDTVWTNNTIPAALKPPTGPGDTTNIRNSATEAKRIEWFAPTTVGHTMQITDINGNVIITAACETANVSQVLWSPGRPALLLKMGGWVLSSLQSGKVIIYY